MASFLITGASRGLGLAFVKELVSHPSSQAGKIIAAKSSGRVKVVKLDVTDQASIKKAGGEAESILGDRGLDVLINNAGICQYSFYGVAAMDNLEESFHVNVIGVQWITQALLPLLKKGTLKKVANISTTLGSIGLALMAVALPAPSYKILNAALNVLTVQYALDHQKEGFTLMTPCPGWLKNDLGGGNMAELTAEEGAKASLDIIFHKGQEVNGQMPQVFVEGWETAEKAKGFNVYDGINAPW